MKKLIMRLIAYNILFKAKYILLFTCFYFSLSYSETTNTEAWKLLIDNKPFEARTAFENNLNSSDKRVVGEAYRGLAFTAKFLGQYETTMHMLFKSFLTDKDTLLLNASWINILPFGRSVVGHKEKEGYRVLKTIAKHGGIYNGEYRSLLSERLVNDGKISKSRKLMDEIGIVRRFMMIGPFDNISGSGYRKIYPPEEEMDFSKKYTGKDGAETAWFPFFNDNTDGWVFTEYNYTSLNSIIYYYSNIYSETDQFVYLGFGASGTFKVFLNDNIVLADSIFRNTGTDMFIQKVRLFKGDNKLLIKIGHEMRYSNFLIRFMNEDGMTVNTLTYKNTPGVFKKDTTVFDNLTNSPYIDYVEKRLISRLEKNPRDPEASILLMDFYNSTELTDKGQMLARTFLKYYPNSSLWHGLYSESLLRSGKITEMQTELKTAYRLCKSNYDAWQNELDVLSKSAGSRDIFDFIQKSSDIFYNTPEALLYKFSHYTQSNNESEAMKIIDKLDFLHSDNETIVTLLSNLYISRGDVKKAEKIIKKFIKWERTSTNLYSLLADMYLKMGQKAKAIKTYNESLRYSPNSPGFYYYLARLSFHYKEYKKAKEYIDKALAITPTSSVMISLKGTILNSLGKRDEAVSALKQSIRYMYNNFDAWEQLLPLQGKPELTSLTKFPDPDSLRAQAKSWEHINSDNGTILAFIKDIIFYPSRCSREKNFVMVHLPTQNAIDLWKEYAISYNSYYQLLNITRAYSRNASGTETPADINSNMIVFKTLQPGDDIVLEWNVENYYRQGMAKQVWGEHEFSLPYPVYMTELKLVTPVEDTIPYTVWGDSVKLSTRTIDNFRITTFSRAPYKNHFREPFALIDPPDADRVFYSTFKSWADISNWYSNITENKLKQTLELKALADSLLKGITSPKARISKIHKYIANAIRYSFVSFRQSAWIPQPAREVLATKIGDCKDMSSLGKSLFDYAGIESNLVLVNTRDVNSIYPTFIGPNFNHCILSYKLDGQTYYLDMTDNHLSADNLPRIDQGALALVIKHDNDSIIHLPVDNSTNRNSIRTIRSTLDEEGNLIRYVETMKRGIFAGNMRSNYRFLSYEEQKKKLEQVLVKSYPNIVIDTLIFSNLDSLKDTIEYKYRYIAENAAQLSGNTVLLALNIPDKITASSYPGGEERSYPIDMIHTWFDIGTFSIQGSITVPEEWRLINIPEKVTLSSRWGTYELIVEQNENEINYTRSATFNFSEPIPIEESEELRNFLSKITRADNIQLMFYLK